MSFRQPAGTEWGYWAVSLIDAALCIGLIVADDSQQDAAGRGLQSGLGVIALIVLIALAALYWRVRSSFVRVPLFIVALLPAVFVMWRSVGV